VHARVRQLAEALAVEITTRAVTVPAALDRYDVPRLTLT
jgi:hypothetical protein